MLGAAIATGPWQRTESGRRVRVTPLTRRRRASARTHEQPGRRRMPDSLKRREGLWPGVEGIAFGQDQQSANAVAVYKHEPEVGCAFGLPAFRSESIDGGGHGAAQVGGGFQSLAFDDFPLQVEENYVARGFTLRVDVVVVPGHGRECRQWQARRLFSTGEWRALYKPCPGNEAGIALACRMRLVTWNCNKGAYSRKVPLLERMLADITVIQECAKPSGESNRCLWFGDKVNQGVLVLAGPAYSIRRLPALDGIPEFVIPIGVSGPGIHFTLLAVWAKAKSMSGYVQCVLTAVELYRELIVSSPCVLMGDLNSSVSYARHCTAEFNHSVLITRLESSGFSSAYHCFFGEAQGMESRPTYYHRWKEQSSFHIDYCFLPSSWVKHIAQVQVGRFDDWKGLSDHRPLVVDVAVEGN
jgi:hypothetical protein